MRSLISPQIVSGVWHIRSSVRPTAPSVEFSTGTTRIVGPPASAARNTSSIEAQGSAATASPKCWVSAAWLKVPAGPR